MGRFDGKVLVITGGGAGIGRRYAHRFAAEGARVAIADLDPLAADTVVGELAVDGGAGMGVAVDVTDVDGARAMAASAREAFGRIDILVNNAGVHLDHAQLPFTLEAVPQWRHVLDVNVIGALICTAACREALAETHGSVINHTSMAAYSASGAYGVSKLALNALTLSLADELAPEGIRVNGIAPGLVNSESATEWANSHTGILDQLVGQQMIKRAGTMDDLADLALFLCSDAASFITGQTILVDGGFTKRPC